MSDTQDPLNLWETVQKKFPRGAEITHGKTKVIYEVPNAPAFTVVKSGDDITAGNGAKHDLMPNKGRYSTETTCNVFEGLKNAGICTAYITRYDEVSFLAFRCKMIPCEVVVRMEAAGSFCKRYPEVPKGTRFLVPDVEFYLKTSGKRWKKHELVEDDPLMVVSEDKDEILLYDPKAEDGTPPFLVLQASEIFEGTLWRSLIQSMANNALRVGKVLSLLWEREDGRLVDFKMEFGFDIEGNLLPADVIDSDSWRVVMDNVNVDKEPYRDGSLPLDAITENYRRVADLTFGFRVPLAPWVLPKKGHALG